MTSYLQNQAGHSHEKIIRIFLNPVIHLRAKAFNLCSASACAVGQTGPICHLTEPNKVDNLLAH